MTELYTQTENAFLIFITILNIFSFWLFYSDKRRAKKNKSRISEKTLLLSAFCLGGIGAYLGMKLFRHKTKHRLFVVTIPLTALITLASILFLIKYI